MDITSLRLGGRKVLASVVRAAIVATCAAAQARAQELRLFPAARAGRRPPSFALENAAGFRILDVEHMYPWSAEEEPETGLGMTPAPQAHTSPEPAPAPAPSRRCVLFQCVRISGEAEAPPEKIFTPPVTTWTVAGLLVGIADAIQGPIENGVHEFHFTDEGFFQYTTYGGGSDKASHFVVSANSAGLLYDAYRLNRLTPDQAFWLSLATATLSGALVEIGDGLTPYGFSAQDLTADALGALSGTLIKRNHLDDLLGVRFGRVHTTIPPAVIGDRPLLGIDYSQEIYTADLKVGGLATRWHAAPDVARFFLFSFVFLTKGYGYVPPLESRYQEIGLELGLNFPEILRAVGVSDATWWGDCLLRAFNFLRIPFTQIGAYYNLKNQKWYGPGAPYHFY